MEKTANELIKEIEEGINTLNIKKSTLPDKNFNYYYQSLLDNIRQASNLGLNTEVSFLPPSMESSQPSLPLAQPPRALGEINICLGCEKKSNTGKVLNCMHYYCYECLEKEIKRATKGMFTEHAYFNSECRICSRKLDHSEVIDLFPMEWLQRKNEEVRRGSGGGLCSLCGTPIPQGSAVVPGCSHPFHSECMRNYLREVRAHTREEVRCPVYECPLPIDPNILSLYIQPVVRQKAPIQRGGSLPINVQLINTEESKLDPRPHPALREGRVFSFEQPTGGNSEVTRVDPHGDRFKQLATQFRSNQKKVNLEVQIIWDIRKREGDLAFMEGIKKKGGNTKLLFLFHGTTEDNIKQIIFNTQGTGFKLPNHTGRLGKGIYFASDPQKCFGYCKGSNLIIRAVVDPGERNVNYKTITSGGFQEYCLFSQNQCQPSELIYFNQTPIA